MVYHYLFGVFLSSVLNCYFQVSYHLKVIFYVAKITQNTVTELLYLILEKNINPISAFKKDKKKKNQN